MKAALIFALLASAVPLSEDIPFQEGKRLLEEFEYERAIFRFKQAASEEDRTPQDKATIFAWLGYTYAQLGQWEDADTSFDVAVEQDPAVVLPKDTSPTIQERLNDARRRLTDSTKVKEPTLESIAFETNTLTIDKKAVAPLPAVLGKLSDGSSKTLSESSQCSVADANIAALTNRQVTGIEIGETSVTCAVEKLNTALSVVVKKSQADIDAEQDSAAFKSTMMIAGGTLLGVGAAAAAGGGAMVGLAEAKKQEAIAEPFQAPASVKRDEANTLITGGLGVLISGGAVLITGIAVMSASFAGGGEE